MRKIHWLATVCVFMVSTSWADDQAPQTPPKDAVTRGFEFITQHPTVAPTMTDALFANIWMIWEDAPKAAAAQATPVERRRMTLERYGMIEAPYENNGIPMGFMRGPGDSWVANCLLCHGGLVKGQPTLGAGNAFIDFTTFAEDATIAAAMFQNKPVPSRPVSLGGVQNFKAGGTNSFVIAEVLLSLRDPNLNLLPQPVSLGAIKDHDLDPPAWWNVSKKKRFYSDGFTPVSARAIMQFALGPENSAEVFKGREEGFKDALVWIQSLTPPKFKYTGPLSPEDLELRRQSGEGIFTKNCSGCHGIYSGPTPSYPNKVVSIDRVGTDRDRLDGVTPEFRQYYKDSWLGNFGAEDITVRPEGYVAPHLGGVWASAPYLHNGSVPTLEQVLNSKARKNVWKVRDRNGLDEVRVGLDVEEFDTIPATVTAGWEKRRYIEALPGTSRSNQGHRFGDRLSDTERRDVIEYLKTL
jgi:mono/diheme cytochrome c family protein